MADKIEDVSLTVRIDVEQSQRDGARLEQKDRQQKDRKKRDTDREEKEDRKKRDKLFQRIKGGVGDVASGRLPSAQRFGDRAMKAAAKIAGFLAVVEFIELTSGAASGVPIIGGTLGKIAQGIKLGKSELTTRLEAYEGVKEYITAKKFAGRPTSIKDAARTFEDLRRGAKNLNMAEIAKELFSAPETAPILAVALGGTLKSIFVDPLKNMLKSDGEIIKEIETIVDKRIRENAEKASGRR